MTVSKQLWVLAGGNGAGKTTFYNLLLAPKGIKLLNADNIACAISPENPEKVGCEAVRVTEQIREALPQKGISFGQRSQVVGQFLPG